MGAKRMGELPPLLRMLDRRQPSQPGWMSLCKNRFFFPRFNSIRIQFLYP